MKLQAEQPSLFDAPKQDAPPPPVPVAPTPAPTWSEALVTFLEGPRAR